MAQLGVGAGTGYPATIDTVQTFVNGPTPAPDSNTRIDQEVINDILLATRAIQTELGVDPAGAFATVVARLNNLIDKGGPYADGSILFPVSGAFVEDATNLTWNNAANILTISGGELGPDRWFLNETANTFQVQGITINQGTNTDEIGTFKGANVNHGMTTDTEDNTFGALSQAQSGSGGLRISGYKGAAGTAGRALLLLGRLGEAAGTTKGLASSGVIEIRANVKSGTTSGPVGADGNMVSFSNEMDAKFIFDADGESHQDVGTAWIAFDDEEDWKMARALRASVLPADHAMALQHAELIEQYKPLLESTGIVTYNADGHHFLAMRRTALFLMDGLFQTGQKVFVDHEQRLAKLEDIPGLLKDLFTVSPQFKSWLRQELLT